MGVFWIEISTKGVLFDSVVIMNFDNVNFNEQFFHLYIIPMKSKLFSILFLVMFCVFNPTDFVAQVLPNSVLKDEDDEISDDDNQRS